MTAFENTSAALSLPHLQHRSPKIPRVNNSAYPFPVMAVLFENKEMMEGKKGRPSLDHITRQ